MRKTILLFLFSTFLSFYLSTRIYADNFTKIPLYGGQVVTASVSPSNPLVLYAGTTYGGSFVSKDGAVTWTALGTIGYNNQNGMSSIAINPTQPNVIVAVMFNTNYAVSRSDDYGATLSGIDTFSGSEDGSQSLYMTKVVASTKNPGKFFVLGTDRSALTGVLYKSIDSGLTWEKTAFSASNQTIQDMAIDKDDNLYVAVADVWKSENSEPIGQSASNVISGYLTKSSDDGSTWTQLKTFNGYPMYIQASSGTIALVNNMYGNDSGTYISRDGINFSSSTSLLHNSCFVTPDGDKIYAIGNDKIQTSSFTSSAWNSAVTISSETFLVLNDVYYRQIVFDSSNANICYMTDFEVGMMKSIDGGYTWSIVNNGMGGMVIVSGAKDPAGNMYVCSGTRIYKGINNGQSWNMVYYPDDGPYNPGNPTKSHKFDWGSSVVIAPAANNVFVGCAGDLWRTTDGGTTWTTVFSSGSNFTSEAAGTIRFSGIVWNNLNPTIGYFAIKEYLGSSLPNPAGKNYIFKSTDSGATWNALNLTSSDYSITSLAIDPVDSTILYVGMGDYATYVDASNNRYGGLWKIIDDGVNAPTWSQIAHTDKIPLNICVSSYALLLSGVEQNDNSLYKYYQPTYYSKDGGVTWAEITIGDGLTTESMNSTVAIKYSNSIYYITDGQSIFAAMDPQANFNKIVEAGELGTIKCLIIGSMYSGANKGLYKLTYAPKLLTEVIEKSKLYGYPNPFNAESETITLKYFVPQGKTVTSLKVSIYNIAGELVNEAPEEKYIVPGYAYYYSWDGKNSSGEKCAEGVYIVMFDSNNDTVKTKVVLTR